MKNEDPDGIAPDIDDIHDKRTHQSHPGVPHGAKEGRIALIHGQKGIGEGGNQKITAGIGHDVRIDPPEEQAQDGPVQKQSESHDKKACGQNRNQELIGRPTGLILPSGPQVLRYDNRASRGQSRHDRDDKLIDHVNQRDS